ncbi:phage/plasmid primase, P4 family [Staphylococcus gallinarum]|uniref:DNA primase family protein n=1 Tax=Staphylococcus gallinarum TaxID=1293 RepID=UPI002DB91C3D|nr:phage/plasmid primase, P4 family [Staphylococcus gallinarum]MEB6241873.1 phage/plasmid primase, P4 family [Staphylococcus gallinarum]MEB6295049.1 phage/plasmid primase, P4 family [Staphylococcus gallinarum]
MSTNSISINEKKYFSGNKFLFYDFATYLYEKYKGCQINGQPHYFNGEYYQLLDISTLNQITLVELPNLSIKQNNEVFHKLKALCSQNVKAEASSKYIGVKNGVFNLETKRLEPFSERLVITSKIDTNYDPNAQSDLLESFIRDVSDDNKDIESLLYQMVGYTLYSNNKFGVAFYLYSNGSNGKSSVMHIINNLVGDEHVTSLSIKELTDKFTKAHLYGSHLNLTDDVDTDAIINNTGILKSLITGERINAQLKYGSPFDFVPRAKIILAGNELFATSDDSYGFFRRLIIVPMTRTFDNVNHNKDPFVLEKLNNDNVKSALLNKALNGLMEAINDNGITEPKISKEYKAQYRTDNSPIRQFIVYSEEQYISLFLGRTTSKAYKNYKEWCLENGFKPVDSNKFGRELKRIGYSSKVSKLPRERKSIRFYTNSGDSTLIYNDKGEFIKEI